MLKTRIQVTVFNDGANRYRKYTPQYKGWIFWHPFVREIGPEHEEDVIFNTLGEAQHFLDIKIAARPPYSYTVPYPGKEI
jgi:hypothetical protein